MVINMKIAVAGEGTNVTEHFGHCVNFLIYDVENGKIVKEESIPNQGHKPGFLPNFLADRGCKCNYKRVAWVGGAGRHL
jgi:predicted Fe-Mo cluster-binding NifX family protein